MNDLPSDFAVGCADEGVGRPLVLVHCGGADRHVWDKMLDLWRAAESFEPRRVLRPELFGCGKTGRWPGHRRVTLKDAAGLVDRAVARAEGPVDLVGHSLGGAVSLFYALHHPERVRTLTLIEPTAFFLLKDLGSTEARLFAELDTGARRIRAGAAIGTEASREDAMASFFDYWNGEGRWQTLPPAVRQPMARLADVIASDSWMLTDEPTRLPDLRALRVPTLLVSGETSPETVRHITALLEQTLPLAERIPIAGAGHMMPITHARQLATLIARYQLPEDGSLVGMRKATARSEALTPAGA